MPLIRQAVTDLKFIYSDEISAGNAPQEIYYISYPNYDRNNMNAENRAELSRIYDLKEVITVENDGYVVEVYRYIKKSE